MADTTSNDCINTDDQCGLIILGNTGVGKSFLANILLGHDVFHHGYSACSVTRATEFREVNLGYGIMAIFNMPGLIEAALERIALNKKEIDKAFSLRPKSIVMFVFDNACGRFRIEDFVAFNAINAAYSFNHESLVFVFNGLPQRRPANYEGKTLAVLQSSIRDVHLDHRNVLFLNRIDIDDLKERQHLKAQLLQIIVELQPSKHVKKQEIITDIDRFRVERDLIRHKQEGFWCNRREKVEDAQRLFNEAITNCRSESESIQRAIQRKQEICNRNRCLLEDENCKNETQLNTTEPTISDQKEEKL